MKIISAFPCTGKSYLFQNTNFKVTDSDSSLFSWESVGVRHKDFPNNYITHIKESIPEFDIILVSSHKIVRDALVDNGIDFTLVYPSIELKDEYLTRCANRGSPEGFVKMLDANWNNFILEIESEGGYPKVKLTANQYLSDIYQLI